jgi:putative Mg2+ transporter-C (MgtC) family protein
VHGDILDIVLRLGAAVLVGMLIGINRDVADKPIGMRTLGLVALGAAVAALATIQFKDLADHPDALSRVVQGVLQGIMAGISFIGAGVIMHDRESKSVEGLTTAATVWVTAALGIACGLAAWPIVIAGILLALFLLIGVAWLEKLYPVPSSDKRPKRR